MSMENEAPNGRWPSESGGLSSPAFRVFGICLLVANLTIAVVSFVVGAPVNGSIMLIVAAVVFWTLWDEARDNR